MRCLAHCLVLLMAPMLANAANAAASDGQGGCLTADAERTPSARSAAAAVPVTNKAAPAPAASAGGGGEDDVLPRLRAPKWHSFLPGMFR